MITRYCSTRFHKEVMPCQLGWGAMDSEGFKSCRENPIKENCNNIVDLSKSFYCPYCGGFIENPFDDVLGIPRNDWRILNDNKRR